MDSKVWMKSKNTTVDLYEYFRFLMKKWRIVAISIGTCGLIMFIYAFLIATPVYEATAQIYVVNSSDSVLNLSDLQIGTYLTSDYQLVFDTWEVNQEVIQNLNLPSSVSELKQMCTITNPSNTRALFITVQSPDAKEAADIANEYASVASKYISDTMLSDKPTLMSLALEELEPVKPKKLLLVAEGIFVGLFLSIIALFIIYALDDKVKTSQDVQKYTGVMPLGVIPVTEKINGGRVRR